MSPPAAWRAALRLLLVSDGRGEVPRLLALVAAAVQGGVRAVQLREPGLDDRTLAVVCDQVRPWLQPVGGILLVNGRPEVARHHADGLQATWRNRPWGALRAQLGAGQLLGASVHSAAELAEADSAGADFAVLAPVLATGSKPGQSPLGLDRARELTRHSPLPLVWLGGLDGATLPVALASTDAGERPLGFAVLGAIGTAADPAAAARALLGIVAGGDGCHTAGR